MHDLVPRLLFFVALAGVLFAAGLLAAHYRLFPYPQLIAAKDTARDLLGEAVRPHYVGPARYPRQGARTLRPGQVAPGVTLITGYWREGDSDDWFPGIRIIDRDGTVLHHWKVEPHRLWPESPHDDRARGNFNVPRMYVHGTHLYPDGDIVFNVEYLGLFRLDSCGSVEWKLPYRTHHSVYAADDGTLWVSGLRWAEEPGIKADLYRGLRVPYVDETAVQVSPEGEILREISLLDVMFLSGYGYFFEKFEMRTGDITHLNDIEVLEADMADAFPTLEAGDIVMSLRNIDTVAVFDPDRLRIKALLNLPLHSQHDPDFMPDGTILIYNNNSDGTAFGANYGGSEIIAWDPATGETRLVYGRDRQQFYTISGGKQQPLDNGNLLITESRMGRIFEVSPEGRLVWEWLAEPFADGLVAELLEGSRYPFSAEQVRAWDCGPDAAG